MLGDGVGVFVGVGHAGIPFEAIPAARLAADDVRQFGDAIVRGAGKTANASVIGGMQGVGDGLDPLKAHLLLLSLFLRRVVDAEELVIAEQNAVHVRSFSNIRRR